MILEGLLTTIHRDGTVNISPMGPKVDADMQSLTLRPFPSSATYENLKRSGQGVFHVTDDVLMVARAAIDKLKPIPEMTPARDVEGWIITSACRWYALRVRTFDDQGPRATIVMDVVGRGSQREFFGLNRAKHAVVEAAILATRVHLLPMEKILAEFQTLWTLVEKTGGPDEHEAMRLLEDYVRTVESHAT